MAGLYNGYHFLDVCRHVFVKLFYIVRLVQLDGLVAIPCQLYRHVNSIDAMVAMIMLLECIYVYLYIYKLL